MSNDVLVLGAGVIGVCTAIHLQKLGKRVVLIDHKGVSAEASSGNAGILVRSSFRPYHFPKDPALLTRIISGRFGGFNYHLRYIAENIGWLASYWRYSLERNLDTIIEEMRPFIETCVEEHIELANEADAAHLLHHSGWLALYRKESTLKPAILTASATSERFNVSHRVLVEQEIIDRFPVNPGRVVGGILWNDPYFCADPYELVKAYAQVFFKHGGEFVRADARTLRQKDGNWSVQHPDGSWSSAKSVVVALGSWSPEVYEPLGYTFPLCDKRGYHMHYELCGEIRTFTPISDMDNGYALTPMLRGVRITTGVEFAHRNSESTPVQLTVLERRAREIMPLGERLHNEPWLGSRSCLPDMKPVIGQASRHAGLWFCFGHNHLGLSLAPRSGRLLAQLMTGQTPCMNPQPFRSTRF